MTIYYIVKLGKYVLIVITYAQTYKSRGLRTTYSYDVIVAFELYVKVYSVFIHAVAKLNHVLWSIQCSVTKLQYSPFTISV